MTGISEVSFLLGENVRTVEEIASFCSEEERAQMKRIGLKYIPTDNDRLLSDMIKAAFGKIHKVPDCIFIAHSLPFIRTDSFDWMPCGKNVPTYYLSGMPCAIMHNAIDAATRLIDSGIYQSVLVVGADKAYSDTERVFFGTIMGDGVVMLLLERDHMKHRILAAHTSTTLYAVDGENSASEKITAFRAANANMVRAAMKECVRKAGNVKIDHIVTHTSTRLFWDSVAKLCRLPRDMFLDSNIVNTGHMNSHDCFFHYFTWCNRGVIKPGENTLLVSPGFGGTQGCTLLHREESEV